jgi:hypothetical protein
MIKGIFLLLLLGSITCSQEYKVGSKEYAIASKTPRYEFSFTYPVIRGFKSNVTAMNMFNKHIEDIVLASSDSFSVWMRDWDTTTTNHEFGSYYEAGDSVFYISDKLISVHFYEGYYFSGAAHPNNSSFSVNYDLEKMKDLTLNDLLVSGWVNTVSKICIKSLMEKIYPGEKKTDSWVEEGAGPKENNFSVFNATKDGLLITFTTYQVASYANGPSEVFIPYGNIKSIINTEGPLSGVIK